MGVKIPERKWQGLRQMLKSTNQVEKHGVVNETEMPKIIGDSHTPINVIHSVRRRIDPVCRRHNHVLPKSLVVRKANIYSGPIRLLKTVTLVCKVQTRCQTPKLICADSGHHWYTSGPRSLVRLHRKPPKWPSCFVLPGRRSRRKRRSSPNYRS